MITIELTPEEFYAILEAVDERLMWEEDNLTVEQRHLLNTTASAFMKLMKHNDKAAELLDQ